MGATAQVQTDAESGRAWVQWYFSERGGVSGSVFEVFSGKGKHQQESGVRSSRVVGLSATRIYATETERQRISKAPISSGLCGAGVRDAIRRLPVIQGHWVNHLYNPDHRESQKALERLLPLATEKYREGANPKTRQSLQVVAEQMLRYQITNYPSYPAFCRWSEDRPAVFTGTQREWTRKYRAYWISARLFLVALDNEAMSRIGRG